MIVSTTSDAILAALGETVKVWLATPQGQKVLEEFKDSLIASAPGVSGALLRALAAAVPHDVESAGFKKDGPG